MDSRIHDGRLSPKANHIALAWLFVIGTLSYMDRFILVILVEPVKAELHLSDTQIGLLNGLAFALLYAIMGVPVAMLADRTHRVRLVAVACFIWSLFTAAGGLATNYLTLAAARTGVGIGEAGSNAPAMSILSDYYPPEKRAFVTGIFASSAGLGIFAGSALGGWIAKAYGWREALLCVGVMGFIAAPLFLLCVREPKRGGADPVHSTADGPALSFKMTVRHVLYTSSLRLIVIGCGLSTFTGIALLAWAPAFLMRVHGLSIAETGAWLGLISGTSFGIGVLGGGVITNALATKSVRSYALVPCIFMLISAPFLAAALLAPSWRMSLLFLFVPNALTNGCAIPSMALVQNLTPSRGRATACSLLILTANIVGVAGGPLVIGLISDSIVSLHGSQSLRIGLLCLLPICLVSAFIFYRCSRSVRADMDHSGMIWRRLRTQDP